MQYAKVLVVRVFLSVLILIFSLQSWTKADDISEFEIEGMSIGDSLLDYFSKDEIKSYINYDSYEWMSEKNFLNLSYTILKDLINMKVFKYL